MNPFLTTQTGHDDLYQLAAARGYLVTCEAGRPYPVPSSDFTAGLIDLTNPAARDWIKGIIKDRLITDTGAIGWMGDFGERLALDAVLHTGESPMVWHNRYPEDWQRIQRDALAETGHGGDGLFSTALATPAAPASPPCSGSATNSKTGTSTTG